jgi:ectoine hydroxylase
VIDLYPTRVDDEQRFIDRKCPVIWGDDYESFRYYAKNGFVILRDFFHKTHIQDAREKASKIFVDPTPDLFVSVEPTGFAARSILGVHAIEPFSNLLVDAELNRIVTSILGGAVYVHQSRINYKAGIGSNGWKWHSDFETWHAQDGMEYMRCVTAMIPLVENTHANGALMVIPGSHHYFWGDKRRTQSSAEDNFRDQTEGVPGNDAIRQFLDTCGCGIHTVLCGPGDLVLFDCNTIHGSFPNMTPYSRENLFFVFNSENNRLVDPFCGAVPRPEAMGTRSFK